MEMSNNIFLLKNRKTRWLLITVGLTLIGIITWVYVNRADPIIFSCNLGKEKLRSPFFSIYNPFRDRTQEEIAEVFLTRIENRFEPIKPRDPIPPSPLIQFIDENIISKAERRFGTVPLNYWYLAGKQENQKGITLSYWIVSEGNLASELCWISFEKIENKWKLNRVVAVKVES